MVGLGKTLMATALSRLFQDPPHSLETLILCPKNLVTMWEDHAARYRLLAKIVPLSKARSVLPDLRRYRIVLLDESHNLRNREGKTYAVDAGLPSSATAAAASFSRPRPTTKPISTSPTSSACS